jgi:hypothetical protein
MSGKVLLIHAMSPGDIPLATVSTTEPRFKEAVDSCVASLRRLVTFELDPPIARRLQDLSERKEFLGETEHGELMALVAFTQRRSVERLEAQLALKRLREILPGVVHEIEHYPGKNP